MSVRSCLNTVTIKQEPDLRRKIEIAAAAGYAGIGLWSDELTRFEEDGGNLKEVRRWLEEAGLAVPEICAVTGWMYAEGDAKAAARDECRRRFAQARALGCGCVVACVSGAEGDLARAADDYRAVCEIADEFGVTPALEFLQGAKQVRNVTTAWEIVRRADHPGANLVVDTFHFHVGGSRAGHLAEIPGCRVGLVHVNDAPDKPGLTDADRVFCGRGTFPLTEIFAALSAMGYSGYYSLELFNPAYWQRDPAEVAKEGLETLRAVVQDAP